jgi:hypothetical protein
MADIVVTCAECGTKTAISEYVDPALAACHICGRKLEVPHMEPTGPRPPPPKSKPVAQPLDMGSMTVSRATSDRRLRAHARTRRRLISWSPSVLSTWLIFVIGTAVLCLLRFVLLKGSDRDLFINGALICMAVLHLTVVVDAFSDNIMTGLLCLFIPFYSIFYLYSQCDSYVLRLAVGVLLAPFGWDGVARVYGLINGLLEMLRNSAMFDS